MTRLALAAVAFASTGTAVLAIPPESDSWHERTSANFRIQGNAPERVTEAYAFRFETLRAALAALNPAIPLRGREKVDVFVFRDAASFRPYARIFANSDLTYPAQYFRSAEYRDVIALLPPAPNAPPGERAYASYLVDLLHEALPNAPEWVRSGLASIYSAAEIDGGAVVVGRPDPVAVRFLRTKPLLPAREFLVAARAPDAGSVLGAPSVFHTQAWALVHYLFVGEEGLRRKFASYLEALRAGVPAMEAFTSTIGIAPEEIDGLLPAFLRQERFGFFRIPIDRFPKAPNPAASPFPRPDLLVRLGWLLASLDPVNASAAEAHFRAALALRPGDATALAGLGWIRSREKRHDEAAADYERAIAADGGIPLWRLLAARNLLARAGAAVAPGQIVSALPEDVARARAILEGALAIAPEDGEVLAAYGATWTWDPGDVKPGIAALEAASVKLPPRADLLLNRVTLHARAGDREGAEALIEGPLRALGDPAAVESARERLTFAEFFDVNRKIESGDLEGALEVLERGRDAAPNDRFRERFDAEIARIEPVVARNRLVALFNEAADLANKGDWKGAAALCDRILAGEPDEELRRRAEEIVGRAKSIPPKKGR